MRRPHTFDDSDDREFAELGAAVGAVAAIVVAAGLVGLRGTIDNTSVALILVLVVVGAAAIGGRVAGVVAAIAAGLSFDFFHTQPYNKLIISDANDIETLLLMMAVGLAAGELVLRIRDFQRRGAVSHDAVGQVLSIARAANSGLSDTEVIRSAELALVRDLGLADCWYEDGPRQKDRRRLAARADGFDTDYELTGSQRGGDIELELRVVHDDVECGRFVLVPAPGRRVSHAQRIAAATMAEVVALRLARSVHRPG